MRIPILEAPRAQSRPISTPYSSVNHDTGLGELAQGAAQFVGGLQRAKAEEAQLAAKAREQASIVASTDAQAEFERREAHLNSGVAPEKLGYEAPPVSGFLQTRGADASRHGAKAQEWLDKQRKDIEEKLATPEAKEIFRQRSQGFLLQARRRMQGHETAQFEEAKVASNAALMEIGLKRVRADYANDEMADEVFRDRSGSLHALARSPEEGYAKSMAWQSAVATARIDAALEADDWRTAERLYEKAQPILGDGGAMAAAITKKRVAVQSETTALEIVQTARRSDGRPDEAAAFGAVEKLPEELRKEARARVKEYIVEADSSWKQQREDVEREVQAAWNANGRRFSKLPQKMKDRLNEISPEKYTELESKSDALFDRWRRHKDDDAGARRAQAQENEILLTRFQALPKDEQKATDIDAWLAKQRESADTLGIEKLKKARQGAAEKVESGQAESEEEFMRDARAAAVRTRAASGKQEAERFSARLRGDFDAFVAKNGRKPTKLEAEALIADRTATKKVPRKVFGIELGEKEVRGWEAEGTPPTAADVNAARKNIPQASKRERAQQLKAAGKTNAEIAKALTEEGY